MTHSIEIWRAELTEHDQARGLSLPVAAAELTAAEEGDEVVIELCRQFPALPRAIAEYLAR
jgi:hypothetical protein